MKHCVTDEELAYLIRYKRIIVADSVLDRICDKCNNEPICLESRTSCYKVIQPLTQMLKEKTSEELADLVINKTPFTF